MTHAWNTHRLETVIEGTILLLTAVCLIGCGGESPAPQVADSVVAQQPAATATTATAEQPPAPASPADAAPAAAVQAPETEKQDTVAVGACDGSGTVQVADNLSGQALADNLLDHWKRNHPEAQWVTEQKERHNLKPPADNSGLLKGGQAAGHQYGNFTQRDLLIWSRETEKFVAEGSRVFHSADELGSSVAVSCDMCHPHASNTHPETYPKYQTQLGRVALLRDMIEWCIENPVRGEHLDPDSAKMRALEAYIMAERKGATMDFGKH